MLRPTITNLLANCGFEDGTFGGWVQSGNPTNTSVVSGNLIVHSRMFAAAFGPPTLGFIAQTVPTIPGKKDDPLLPGGSVHLAFFFDTIHEISGRVDFYRKVRHALKPNGRMAVIDWIPSTTWQGETRNEPGGQVSRDVTVREVEEAGFHLIKEPKFLAREYFLVFERMNEPSKPPQNPRPPAAK